MKPAGPSWLIQRADRARGYRRNRRHHDRLQYCILRCDPGSGYGLFLHLVSHPGFYQPSWNNALVVLQADRKYGSILLLKAINSVGFFLVLVANSLFFDLSLTELVWAQILINGITSAWSLLSGWDGLLAIRRASRSATATLFPFWKIYHLHPRWYQPAAQRRYPSSSASVRWVAPRWLCIAFP